MTEWSSVKTARTLTVDEMMEWVLKPTEVDWLRPQVVQPCISPTAWRTMDEDCFRALVNSSSMTVIVSRESAQAIEGKNILASSKGQV